MSIRNLKDGSKKPWLCQCFPNGRDAKRVRKRFATRGEAAAYEIFLLKQKDEKPWLAAKPDHRRLSNLIDLWFTHYGATLTNGSVIKSKFLKMAEAMGNPVASTFTSKTYSEFRSQRMTGAINFVDARWQKGTPSISTLNSELARFKAMFNKLKELREWKGQNPLKEIKPFKNHERAMTFLQTEQVTLLLKHVESHKQADMLKIVKLCLSTGARWNEAAQLSGSQLSKYKVTFTNTKTKKTARYLSLKSFTMRSISLLQTNSSNNAIPLSAIS